MVLNKARQVGMGCNDCLVVAYRLPAAQGGIAFAGAPPTGQERILVWWDKFDDPKFNPRWGRGTANHVFVVQTSEVHMEPDDEPVEFDVSFTERELRLIRNSQLYARSDPAGLPGHNLMVVVEKLTLLPGVQEALDVQRKEAG